MKMFFIALVSLTLTPVANATPVTSVKPSSSLLDYGIVAGAFAPKPVSVKAGNVTYHVITPDLIEPACNSTQIVIWVEDNYLEANQGGVAYNLGEQISKVLRVTSVGDEIEILFARKNIDDCSTSNFEVVYVKYLGDAKPLSIRR